MPLLTFLRKQHPREARRTPPRYTGLSNCKRKGRTACAISPPAGKHLKRFRIHSENQGINHIHECNADTVEQFLRSLRAKNGVDSASPKTWNNYRADLSTFFSWSRDPRRRWILENPCESVIKIKLNGTGEPDCPFCMESRTPNARCRDSPRGKARSLFRARPLCWIRPGPEGELYKLADHTKRDRLIDLKRELSRYRLRFRRLVKSARS